VLCAVRCVLCSVFCVLCAVFCVLCSVFSVLCSVCCVLCAVCCVLCAVCCVLRAVFTSLKCEVDNLEELCALCLLSALCSLLSALCYIRFAYFLIEDECFQREQQQQEQRYFSILYIKAHSARFRRGGCGEKTQFYYINGILLHFYMVYHNTILIVYNTHNIAMKSS
jgi:hypothetical protein